MTSDRKASSSSTAGKLSLRERGQRPNTPTADVAATAIDFVLRRRASRRNGAVVVPVPESLRRKPIAKSTPELVPTQSALRWQGLASALLVAVSLLVALAFFAGSEEPAEVERHVVHGTVTLRGRPLADSVVEFHRLDASGLSVETACTDTKGHFVIGDTAGMGVPSGEYGVVIRGRRRVVRGDEVFFDQVSLPPQYAKPDATPLKAFVTGPVTRMSLAIVP